MIVKMNPVIRIRISPREIASPVTVLCKRLWLKHIRVAFGVPERENKGRTQKRTLPRHRKKETWYILCLLLSSLFPTIVQTGHLAKRDDSPPASSFDVISTMSSTDPIVPMSGRLNAMATMASTAIVARARRHECQLNDVNGGSGEFRYR